MEISTELLAAYAEGKVTKEERNQVRQYLMGNPEELETVMMFMDDDYELEPTSGSTDNIGTMGHVDGNIVTMGHNDRNNGSFSDIALSAAAFAPAAKMASPHIAKLCKTNSVGHPEKKSTFNSRLDSLMDELGI